MEPNVLSVENGEAQRTLAAAIDIRDRAEAINRALPAALRDGFYELVLYPVRMQAAVAERFIDADLNVQAARTGRADEARAFADQVDAAARTIDAETAYFNDGLAGGKWRGILMERGNDRADVFAWPKVTRDVATTTQPTTRQVDDVARNGEAWSAANRAWPFVESNGCVSIDAAHFTRTTPSDTAWHSVGGLGRSGAAIVAWPPAAASHAEGIAPAEYDLVTTSSGPARLDVYVLPTHATNIEHGARFAASIDDGKPQVVDFNEEGGPAGEMSPRWASNVTRNVSVNTVPLTIAAPGRHTVKLWIVDPGVVVDKLVLNLGDAPRTECGPPESRQLAPSAP